MKNILETIFIFLFLSLLLPLSVSAIGQMTKPIDIQNALKGQEYEKTLILFNSEEGEAIFDLLAEGKIAPWATFYSPDDLENPIEKIKVPGASSIEAVVRFTIPEDTPNATYSGTVSVLKLPESQEESEGMAVTITQKIARFVSITVTGEEVIGCEARIVPQKLSLEKNEPLKINVICLNTGNVRIKPQIQQKIFKGEKTIFNVIYPYPEGKEGIKPNHSETLPIEWQTVGQERGDYQTEITVLLDEEVVEKQDFTFRIGGTLGFLNFTSFLANIGQIVKGIFAFPFLSLITFIAIVILGLTVEKKTGKKKKGGVFGRFKKPNQTLNSWKKRGTDNLNVLKTRLEKFRNFF